MNKENEMQLKFPKIRFYIILLLSLIGIGLCIELGIVFYKTNFLAVHVPSICSISELIDCDGVAKSSYALTFGVPNALWGLVLYSIFLMLLFVDRIQMRFKNTIFDVFENPRSYICAIGIISFALSMVLAGISIFKIHKICIFCFATYFINLFVAIAASSSNPLRDIKITVVDFIKGAKKYFILFVIVLIAFVSALVYLDSSLLLSPKLKKERAFKEFTEAKTNKYAIKGNILGHENASVTINIYSDYNCPFCKSMNIMLHKASKTHDIIVNEVNFPLDVSCNKKIAQTLGGHENSCLYSRIALASKKQGKLWGSANILFYKTPSDIDQFIAEAKKAHLGLDEQQLKSDINSPEILNLLNEDIDKTISKNIYGTPAIEINDVLYIGGMYYDELIEKITSAEKRAKIK